MEDQFQALSEVEKLSAVDKRLFNTIWAESSGGTLDEIKATTSTFLNRVLREGYEKALKGSSAYRKRSKEYVKARDEMLNEYELKKYLQMKEVVQNLVTNPEQRDPWTYFENLSAIGEKGEPYWVKGEGLTKSKDIGRQRYYTK